VIAVEGLIVARRITSPAWVHAVLLVATIISTMFAARSSRAIRSTGFFISSRGTTTAICDSSRRRCAFAITLLLILGIHEMGHYFAARRHGVDVTCRISFHCRDRHPGDARAVIFIKSALARKRPV